MYNDITIFEVKKRIEFLNKAKNDVVTYFNNINGDWYSGTFEDEKARQKRQEINFYLKKLTKILISSGVNTTIYYSPPPAFGGLSGNIELISNIFNLTKFQIEPIMIVDNINQSLGIYCDEYKGALIRTFNPFWWLWEIIKSIAYLPFWLLKEIGFNTEKLESNFLGKLLKLIFEAVAFLAALFAVLRSLGYEETFLKIIKQIFRLPS